jgi:hypothetical protein
MQRKKLQGKKWTIHLSEEEAQVNALLSSTTYYASSCSVLSLLLKELMDLTLDKESYFQLQLLIWIY